MVLLGLLRRWQGEAAKVGRKISRLAVAFEAGRDEFWLARWLRARGIEAYVIHATSIAVSREHRRAKTDRLDTEFLKRAFIGWLRPMSVFGLTAAEVSSDAQRVERTQRDVRLDGADHYFVVFLVRGQLAMTHNDQTVRLAAGDVAFPEKFTHAAMATARLCVANALHGANRRARELVIPHCTYTDPEVAQVGLTPRRCMLAEYRSLGEMIRRAPVNSSG